MFTMTRDLKETLRQHFASQKLEISYAIYKPFPFFEGLRDKSFISERMYMESLEACRNMVPVSRVVYNVLSNLEKTFNLSFLEMLFNQINLREYPNLMTIFRSFRNVAVSCGGWRRTAPGPFGAPPNPVERSLHLGRLPLPAPQRPVPRSPIPVSRISEPGPVHQHRAAVPSEPSNSASPAEALPRVTQIGRITPVSIDDPTPQTEDGEDAQEMAPAPSAHVPVIRNDSPEPSEPTEPQAASRSTPATRKGKKRKRNVLSSHTKRNQKKSRLRGTASPGHRTQETPQVVEQATQRTGDSTWNSQVVTRARRARTEHAQTPGPEEISDDTSEVNEETRPKDAPSTPPRTAQESLDSGSKRSSGKSGGKQKRRKRYSWSTSKRGQRKRPLKEKEMEEYVCSRSTRSCKKNRLQKKNPAEETVDFQPSTFPVTCGRANGVLHKEKMEKGSSEKSIQNDDGVWLTPHEFEVKGRGPQSKNWKRNVRCAGQPLQQLMEKGLLFCPPRTSLKREVNCK